MKNYVQDLEPKQKNRWGSILFSNRPNTFILLGIWLLSIIVRLLLFAFYHDRFALLDEPTYGYIFAVRAHNWLKGRGMVGHDRQVIYAIQQAVDGKHMKDFNEINLIEPKEGYYPDDYETPGYSVWIALVWKLFGRERLFDVRLLQAIVSSFMVFPIFMIGRKLLNEKIGFLSSIVWALYLPEARFSIMTIRDVWITWASILFVWAFLQTKSSNDHTANWIFWSVLAGLFGALTAYMRSSALLYMPCIILFAFFLWNKRLLIKISIIIGLVMFASLFPWAKRNHDLFGQWELRGWFHYALLSGLCEGDPSLYHLDPLRDQDGIDPLTIPDSSRTAISPTDESFKHNVIQVYKDRPWWCAKLAGQRFLKCVFGAYLWGINDDVYLDSRTKPLKERIIMYFHYPFLVFKWVMEKSFYPAALLTLILFRNYWRSNLILIAALFYFPIFHGMTIFQSRFILPGTWPLCVICAQYLKAFMNWFGKRS